MEEGVAWCIECGAKAGSVPVEDPVRREGGPADQTAVAPAKDLPPRDLPTSADPGDAGRPPANSVRPFIRPPRRVAQGQRSQQHHEPAAPPIPPEHVAPAQGGLPPQGDRLNPEAVPPDEPADCESPTHHEQMLQEVVCAGALETPVSVADPAPDESIETDLPRTPAGESLSESEIAVLREPPLEAPDSDEGSFTPGPSPQPKRSAEQFATVAPARRSNRVPWVVVGIALVLFIGGAYALWSYSQWKDRSGTGPNIPVARREPVAVKQAQAEPPPKAPDDVRRHEVVMRLRTEVGKVIGDVSASGWSPAMVKKVSPYLDQLIAKIKLKGRLDLALYWRAISYHLLCAAADGNHDRGAAKNYLRQAVKELAKITATDIQADATLQGDMLSTVGEFKSMVHLLKIGAGDPVHAELNANRQRLMAARPFPIPAAGGSQR